MLFQGKSFQEGFKFLEFQHGQKLDTNARITKAILNGTIGVVESTEVLNALVQLKNLNDGTDEYLVLVSPSFRSDQTTFEQNRYRCLPLLRDALDGSSEARAEYERNRLCCPASAAPYAQSEIERHISSECDRLRPAQIAPGDGFVAHKALKIWLDGYKEDRQLINASGMHLVISYRMMERVLEHFAETSYKPTLTFTYDSKGHPTLLDRLNPASDGPLGKLSFDCWKFASQILLASVIVEDLLADLQIQLNGATQLTAIRACRSPWDICDSKLVQNCRLLANLRDTQEISPEVYDRILKKPERLLMANFQRQIEDINHALSSKTLRKSQPTLTVAVSAPKPTNNLTPSADEFFTALAGASNYKLDAKQFRKEHRGLFSLYKKGKLSLDDCLQAVREGTTASELVKKMRGPSDSVATQPTKTTSVLRRLARLLSGQDTANPPEVPLTYSIEGKDSNWFKAWHADLGPAERNLVDSRLKRAELGFFGNYSPLRSDSRLFQFRFFLGDAKRLFFCFPDDGAILLVGASSKDGQDRTVRELSENLDTILADWKNSNSH